MFKKIKDYLYHHKILATSFSIIFFLGFIVLAYSAKKDKLEYIHPKYGEIVEAIYGLGKVKTDQVYEVKIGVSSTVQKLYVKEGDYVKKSDPLVLLDDGVIFRAPYPGTITQVNAAEKQSIFPQMTIIRLEDYSTKYIEVSLEQQGALRVKPGQSVKIMFESLRGDQLTGKVLSIFSRNDEFIAKISVPSLKENVLPGMTADISIEVGRKSRALLVPVVGVNSGQVIIERSGKRMTVPVKIGSIDGNWAEVLEGDIQESDQIIVKSKP